MEPQNFLGLGGLTELGGRSGMDMRPTLLRVLTDLYVHRLSHTPDEERHYTELALRMLEVVDVPTRIASAKRFARYPSPPLRVLQWLARDLPDVAAELRSHPLLQPPAPSAAAQQNTRSTPIAERSAPGDDEQRADRSAAIELDHSPKAQRSFLRRQTPTSGGLSCSVSTLLLPFPPHAPAWRTIRPSAGTSKRRSSPASATTSRISSPAPCRFRATRHIVSRAMNSARRLS